MRRPLPLLTQALISLLAGLLALTLGWQFRLQLQPAETARQAAPLPPLRALSPEALRAGAGG